MFYFMESATIIIFFARLYTFRGDEGGCEKEYSLYAYDNDEKDERAPKAHLTSQPIADFLYSLAVGTSACMT
jgi:hypothetical protein